MEAILDILVAQWMYDVEVMSQPWMYWCVFPIMFYLVFFFTKWIVLTAPVWLPLVMIVGSLRRK